jgi:hypothetical protein
VQSVGIVRYCRLVYMLRGHQWGSIPATLGFAAFVGGLTILRSPARPASTVRYRHLDHFPLVNGQSVDFLALDARELSVIDQWDMVRDRR